jgi:hypothetical protein
VPIVLSAEAIDAAEDALVVIELEAPLSVLRLDGLEMIDSQQGTITLAEGVLTIGEGASFARSSDALTGAETEFPVAPEATEQRFASTRISGSEAALNAFFSTFGKVYFDAGFASRLGVRVVDAVQSRGEITIVTHVAAEQGAASPSLILPERFDLPVGGALVLPAQAVAGSGLLAMTLTVSSGDLAWIASDTLKGSAAAAATLTAGRGKVLTLVGTAAALNEYVAQAGNLRYFGVASPAVIEVQVAAVETETGQAGFVPATARSEAQLFTLALGESASQLQLRVPRSQSLASEGTSTIVFDNDLIVGSTDIGSISLTFSPVSVVEGGSTLTGQFMAYDDAVEGDSVGADGVAVTLLGDGRLQLTGSSADLNAWLATEGRLRYEGPSGAIGVEAFAAGGLRAQASIDLVRPAGDGAQLRNAPRLALPTALVADANGALAFGESAIRAAAFSSDEATLAARIEVVAGGARRGDRRADRARYRPPAGR